MANKPHTSRAKATPAYAKPNTSRRSTPARPSAPAPSRTVVIVVAVVAALAVAAAVIAVVVANGSSSKEPSTAGLSQTQPVTVTGTALTQLPDSGADPAIGVTAPTLAGLSFDGTPVDIGASATNATLVVFAAHWCPHCQREIPKLADWQPPAGVDVVAVATQTSDDAPNYPPSSWLTKSGWTWPVLADSPTYEAAAAYGMVSWPGFVLLDKDGVVRWRGTGEIELDTLTSTITTALGETSSSTPPTT
jgi:cytochrome c biogenesis protein CcmG, thiol:disulfide interchange protein DsbE